MDCALVYLMPLYKKAAHFKEWFELIHSLSVCSVANSINNHQRLLGAVADNPDWCNNLCQTLLTV